MPIGDDPTECGKRTDEASDTTGQVSWKASLRQSPAVPLACEIDWARRSAVAPRPRTVLLADHLASHPLLKHAFSLLADIRAGNPLDCHLPPLGNPRGALRRGRKKSDWRRYRPLLDHLLNKWGFRHFHCDGGKVLAFVHLCDFSGVARIIDLLPHDGNLAIERRLVEIVVRNWPDAEIARSVGNGPSRMTESDLVDARKQGLHMVVNVDGTYYLPARCARMSDGTSYIDGFLRPVAIVPRRYDPARKIEVLLNSPHSIVVGMDPDDPRPTGVLVAIVAGMLAARPAHLRQYLGPAFAVTPREYRLSAVSAIR